MSDLQLPGCARCGSYRHEVLDCPAPGDEPLGFTREDVRDELDAAEELEQRARGPFIGDNYPPLDWLANAKSRAQRHRERADRIAALLPPEKG
jgi:predicted TIM-barrel fold metal-dependent hydrolase